MFRRDRLNVCVRNMKLMSVVLVLNPKQTQFVQENMNDLVFQKSLLGADHLTLEGGGGG